MNNQDSFHVVSVDPEEDWQEGWIGFFLRYRGFATKLFIDSGLLWATWKFAPLIVFYFIGAVAMALFIGMAVMRHFCLQRVKSDCELHDFCHLLRDESANIAASDDSRSEPGQKLAHFMDRMASEIADYFRAILPSNGITCTIRIAVTDDADHQVYITFGRSNGLDASRKENSQPIPADKGLPGKLRSADYRGVFIVTSIQKAIQNHTYLKTKNDDLKDCVSCIVAPINGWENGQKVMLGTLSVGSKYADTFRRRHTTPLRSFADLLGLVLPVCLVKLKENSRIIIIPQSFRGPSQSRRQRKK